MERRELLKMIAVLTGGAVIGGEVFLSGCKQGAKSDAGFTAGNIALLDEVGETILPATDTPGAKAAQIGAFMQTIVTDCYSQAEQDVFNKGMAGLDKACEKLNGKSFMNCSGEQRKNFLIALEKEAKDYNDKKNEAEKTQREGAKKEGKEFTGAPPHYYSMIKQLTLFGYFSSEIGQTKALRLLPVPGKYDGAYPYKKGDKAWAI
jgi:Gluconate 2-dehydrogenase subunit 3